MKRTILAALIALSPLAAQANDWITITRSADGQDVYSAKKRTGAFATNRGGEAIYSVLMQTETRGRYSYSRMYVRVDDCLSGYGKLVSTDPTSGSVQFSSSYAKGGASIASAVAEFICLAAAVEAQQSSGNTNQRY